MSAGTVQSLDRGLLVLELLSQAEHGLSLQELCHRLGMKPPTLHNLLRTLATRGYVEKTRKPVRYRLGPAPHALVQRQARRRWLVQVETVLPELVRRLGVDHALFAEPMGGEVRTVRRVSRSQPELMQRPQDSLLTPYASASGLLFQACWPAPERDAYRQRYPFAEYGQGLWPDMAALEAYLAEVRRLGYSLPPGTAHKGWRLAVPVTEAGGQLIGALGVYRSADAAPSDADQQTCIETVRAAAQTLSARLSEPPSTGD